MNLNFVIQISDISIIKLVELVNLVKLVEQLSLVKLVNLSSVCLSNKYPLLKSNSDIFVPYRIVSIY